LRRWLLFGRRLKFDFGGGAVKLALELISGFLEFPQTLAKTSCELGKFFCTEEQHHYHKNEDSFGPAGHADSDWKTHKDNRRKPSDKEQEIPVRREIIIV
jgi:hypothetical protein